MKTLMRQGGLTLALLTVSCLVALHSRAQEAASSPRKVLVKTPAIYPSLARSMNIRGVVKIEATVAPNGTIKNMDVKGGHPLLTQSAVTAIGHWKFETTPHETKEMIEVKFDPE